MKTSQTGPWVDISVPAAVRAIPSMLTVEELQYLIWVVATQYTGRGAIVDLGPWVGSSTAALAEGLRRSGAPAQQVHSYDLFEWRRGYMEQYAPEDLPEGSDFRPLLLCNVREYQDLVDAQRMDLFSPNWRGEPIEILFVDAAKSWDLLSAILRAFGPHLVPGRSRIILQDFRFFHTYWLPLVFDSRPDVWREAEGVENGTTVSFEVLKAPFGPAGIHDHYDADSFPLASAHHILDRRAREPGPHQTNYLLMQYRVACVNGDEPLMARMRAAVLGAAAPGNRAATADLLDQALQYSTDECVERAWTALKAKNLDAARRAVAASFLDGRAHALIVRGRIAQLAGDLPRARDNFLAARAIEDHPAGHTSLFLAECDLTRGNLDQCAAEVKRFLDSARDPGEAPLSWATHILGECWLQQKDLALAQSTSQWLATAFPASPSVRVLAATVAREAGQVQQARQHAEAALGVDAQCQRARDLLAQLPPRP